MSDAVYSIPRILSLLMPVFEIYKVRKAVLFGSYAKGNAEQNSDVDILVDSGMKGMAFLDWWRALLLLLIRMLI